MSKFMSAKEAVKLIKDGDSIAVSGNGEESWNRMRCLRHWRTAF